MRQMLGKRKPSVVIAIGGDKAPPAESEAEEAAESPEHEAAESPDEEAAEHRPKDVVTCPDCGCEINTLTGKAITDDGSEPDEAPAPPVDSLDEADSQYNKPGPFGSAADASRAAEAQAKLLGALRKD